jgi:FKBP-type peptidyl-prolyl cis-trans isomerase 2
MFDTGNSGYCRLCRARYGTYSNSGIGGFPAPDIEEKSGALVEFSVDTDDFAAGQVLAVNDEQVKVDFNHLLIGENVKFEVEGLAVIERDG